MSIPEIIVNLLVCLLITILIEGVCTAIMTRSFQLVKCNVYCNLMTNPLLNMIAMLIIINFSRSFYYAWVVIGEFIVLFGEMLLYRLFSDLSIKRSFILSLVTNLLSFTLGSGILSLISK